MTWFNVLIESNAKDPTDDQFDQLEGFLAEYSPSVGMNPDGQLSTRISIQAVSLRQATEIATLVINDSLNEAGISGSMASVHTLTEEEFLRRERTPEEADVVGTAEAAEILGVSTQRVVQLAARLNAVKVGKTLVFPRKTVELAVHDQEGGGSIPDSSGRR